VRPADDRQARSLLYPLYPAVSSEQLAPSLFAAILSPRYCHGQTISWSVRFARGRLKRGTVSPGQTAALCFLFWDLPSRTHPPTGPPPVLSRRHRLNS
jgi:hypothetical protein